MSDAAIVGDVSTDAGTPPPVDHGNRDDGGKFKSVPVAASGGKPAAQSPAKTVAADPGDIDPSDGGPEGYWPEDWRDRVAGDDTKFRKLLDRFPDPSALGKKVAEQEKLIRSRKVMPEHPGKDATVEELAEYRKAVGLPEDAEGYFDKIKLSGNKQLGDDDRPMAEYFARIAHANDISQDKFNSVIDAMLDYQEDIVADQIAADDKQRKETRDTLRDEWGPDFKRNINTIGLLFADAPDVFEDLLAARTKSGILAGDHPEVVKWLVGLAHKIHDEATIADDGRVSSMKDLETRKGELDKLVAKDNSEYWRGPNAERLQKEYADIIGAIERASKRKAA